MGEFQCPRCLGHNVVVACYKSYLKCEDCLWYL